MKKLILLSLVLALGTRAFAVTLSNPVGQSSAATSAAVTLSNENVQDLNITGAATQTVVGQNIVNASAGSGATDANGYRSISIEVTPTGTVSSGVVTFEASNDNTTFFAVAMYDSASGNSNPSTTISPTTGTTRFMAGPLTWRYFRARISTVIGGGGSIAAVTRLSQVGFQPPISTVAQAAAANLNATVAQATAASLNATVVQGTPANLKALVSGTDAISAATTVNPLMGGARVTTTLDTTLVQGDAAALNATDAGQLITKPFGSAGNDWAYATPIASPITNTTAVAFKSAGAASIRNYVTGIQYINTSATASIVTIQDGATVIWTGYAPASMTFPVTVQFLTPLRGTAATAMNFVVNTTATNTFVSAQGYQSF